MDDQRTLGLFFVSKMTPALLAYSVELCVTAIAVLYDDVENLESSMQRYGPMFVIARMPLLEPSSYAIQSSTRRRCESSSRLISSCCTVLY